MKIRSVLSVAAIVFMSPGTSWAEDMPVPKVGYSADSFMETEEATIEGTVYSAPGKERREMYVGGEKSIMIIRRDKNVMWNLMPEERMYMEMGLSQARQRGKDISGYSIEEQTVVGTESLNGMETTKHRVIMSRPDGSKFGGFMWLTDDGILVKMDAIGKEKGSRTRIKTELTNIRVGSQDPALFEVPAGYTKFSMDGFSGMKPPVDMN